eukprot:scaffold30643_cov35-Tisochrysis_lutea.AAC.5
MSLAAAARRREVKRPRQFDPLRLPPDHPPSFRSEYGFPPPTPIVVSLSCWILPVGGRPLVSGLLLECCPRLPWRRPPQSRLHLRGRARHGPFARSSHRSRGAHPRSLDSRRLAGRRARQSRMQWQPKPVPRGALAMGSITQTNVSIRPRKRQLLPTPRVNDS